MVLNTAVDDVCSESSHRSPRRVRQVSPRRQRSHRSPRVERQGERQGSSRRRRSRRTSLSRSRSKSRDKSGRFVNVHLREVDVGPHLREASVPRRLTAGRTFPIETKILFCGNFFFLDFKFFPKKLLFFGNIPHRERF